MWPYIKEFEWKWCQAIILEISKKNNEVTENLNMTSAIWVATTVNRKDAFKSQDPTNKVTLWATNE